MKYIIILSLFFFLGSCNSTGGGGEGGATEDLSAFKTESCGDNVTRAFKKDAEDNFIEQGYIYQGKRNGVWLTYYTGKEAGKIKTVASYANGSLNGPYYEMSNRGQIEKEINYKNNMLHGKVIKYKFGRPTQIKSYKDNKLDGPSIEYTSDNKIQKEMNFKNGKQHGIMKWYNESGEVTMEYEYKNGEKVSGGIVE